MRSDDLYSLPDNLPIPMDDGACDHLAGMAWPSAELPSTDGALVSLAAVAKETPWLVVYFYPRTGLPDQDPPGGLAVWDAIPGARGCTPQACAYRDHHAELRARGARIFGVSTQDTAYRRLTLLGRGETIERCFYPVFPPDADAANLLAALTDR